MKLIDSDKLKAEIKGKIAEIEREPVPADRETLLLQMCKKNAFREVLSVINRIGKNTPQQGQQEEICSKCVYHKKDDGYCYYPHGGMRRRINENGVYECTEFCEKEQKPVDLEKAAKEYAKINDKSSITKGFSVIKFAAFKAGAEWQRIAHSGKEEENDEKEE